MPSSAEEARKRAMKLASEAEVRRTWTGSHRMPRSRLEGVDLAPAVVAGPPPLPPLPPRMLVRSNSAEVWWDI
ncbi:unnamed protein product [Durusdinium trenchii]|uniref:Uncharacterized protein n=1 Tax=Durusdinium trenchii TaxID=1381693 RepID=A0ABP0NRP8_9DINO